MPFTLQRIQGFPDDGVVSLVHVAPVVGGPGAIVTFKQADRIRVAWVYGAVAKLLDDDVFRADQFKDADGVAWLAMDGKLYAVVSHAVDGTGASSRLYLGSMDAPWSALAYQSLGDLVKATVAAALATYQGAAIDQQARDLANGALTKAQALEGDITRITARLSELGAALADASRALLEG